MSDKFEVEVFLEDSLIDRRPLGQMGLSIGRCTTNDIVLENASVSKRHATLSCQSGQIVLRDLGSSQGTVVRGVKVQFSTLSVGDAVQIGPFTLMIVRQLDQSVSTAGTTGRLSTVAFKNLIDGLLRLTELVGVSDLGAVLDTLLEHSMGLVNASRGFVVLVHDNQLSAILARHGNDLETDETFSRTVCQRAVSQKESILLADSGDRSALDSIVSLDRGKPILVLAVPLIHDEEVLGILYLESEKLDPPLLKVQPDLLQRVSRLGGRSLWAALERRQIIASQEEWRWLGTSLADEVDIFRSARDPSMVTLLDMIQKTAREDVTVLIRGETGTGKDVTAHAIHRLSKRCRGPFVAVNCGAIPKELMESELFGYERGAFTGAIARKIGRFGLAQGGTILLDEIGDMPKDLQVKLLRILESKCFERLGGQESVHLDVRVLAATNRDLEEAVGRDEFRKDLFYRINVVGIRVPALRERRQDIEPLVHEMLVAANKRFKRRLYGVTPEALAAMQEYHWPGNIRELRNVIDRAFILESSDRITVESLPFRAGVTRDPPAAQKTLDSPSGLPSPVLHLDDYLLRQERDYVALVLRSANDNVTHAAALLGMTRPALHRRLRRLGLRGDSDEA